MSKFSRKFLECISDIISKNPKIVKIFHKNRGQYGFVHFEKQHNLLQLVNVMGYQIYLDITEKQTKIRIQPIVLSEKLIWLEFGDECSGVVTGKDHLLFKPLPPVIEKAQIEEEKKAVVKIEEKFLNNETIDIDPLSIIYEEFREKIGISQETQEPKKSFTTNNPELIDYTKAHWDGRTEPVSERKETKKSLEPR